MTAAALPGPALLFCPADRPDRVLRAHARADAVIVDLEDAVAPAAKGDARERLAEVAAQLDPARAIVRINASDSDWIGADVETVRAGGLETVMLPKASSPEQLAALAPLRVIALCETAAGVLGAADIAAAPNCAALFWGGEDLIADVGGRSSRRPDGSYRAVVEHARASVLLAAAAADRPAIDAIHPDIADVDGIRDEAAEAAGAGFAAKACIHPIHVAPIREAFRPTADEAAWARGVLEAAERAERGVFAYQGRMVDEPLLRHARSIVAAAEQPTDRPKER